MPNRRSAHPGTYVRENIIPVGMSVTDAAKRLGIGRPALSSFLNGKSALSPKMAVRLEKAFGADRKGLLEMQVAFSEENRRQGEKQIAVRAFVPSFLTIKARQIEGWAASQIDARTHLPVLLRKLVHSTGTDLRRVDFPGNDNAERKGSDGFVESGTATPWIPEGNSYWELGTGQNPDGKAEQDYKARLKTVDNIERAHSTFVFVTPRNWPGKTAWEKQKRAASDWRDVKAFDASDLEQWLEQSVPGQIWLAERLDLQVSGYETLEQAWCRWANASEPQLTPEIFAPSVAVYGAKIKTWLDEPSTQPFVVAADSRDEALAFLACLFDKDELQQFSDLAAVFTSAATLRTLLASATPFIPIVYSEGIERQLIYAHRQRHCIVVSLRNAVDRKADIALDLLDYTNFEKALTAMGIERGDVDRFARASGRSPTILRRYLSHNTATRIPAWASDHDMAKTLVPLALIGAWQEDLNADREIISQVGDRRYEAIATDVARLLGFDDSPVWSAGPYRGVASKIDALFAAAGMVTSMDLDRFFRAAETVLSEPNPALDLPEEKRWAAAMHGKTRDHSSALREGICETLVILSVHGENLFQDRLGINVAGRIVVLIRKLLAPLTLDKLLHHEHNLPRYAEAASGEFLKIIEEDLRRINPVVFGLLKPVQKGLFGASPSRTGLLWALECLAWNPIYLPRVSKILARLSRAKIDDNWLNKPEASLQAIFRSWMPQTAASVEQRVKVLKILTTPFPDVVWEIAIEQIKLGPRTGMYSYRPHWRSDASGAGQVVTDKERCDFTRNALDLLIAWPSHDEKTLGDLIESLQGMPEKDQIEVWDLVDEWSNKSTESAKAVLRERIRRFAFTRRGRSRGLAEETRDRARDAYERLRPDDPVIRHGWLFAKEWVDESAEEIEVLEDGDFNYRKSKERIDGLRREAVREILEERDFDGVRKLLFGSDAAKTVGQYVALCTTDITQRVAFIRWCLSLEGDLRSKAEWCLQGFLRETEDEMGNEALRAAAEGLSDLDCQRLFVCAPFQAPTWRLLDDHAEDFRTGYWKNAIPSHGPYTPIELTVMIDCLLAAGRPRAAFYASQMHFDDLDTSRLKRLLRNLATVDAEPPERFVLNNYYISEALGALDSRAGVTRVEMAQLEFLFVDALARTKHGIRNLEKQVAESPEVFVQTIVLAFKRSDDGEDPPEWKIKDPNQRDAAALAALKLLDQVKRLPGTDEDGKINVRELTAWLVTVRRLCRDYARAEIGDQYIGQLLARAPKGESEIWPCAAVCEAMEEIASPHIRTGFYIGIKNSRGVIVRDEGGEQERELATKYRSWAERLGFNYPYVADVLGDIASSYEREAKDWDSRGEVLKRLDYWE